MDICKSRVVYNCFSNAMSSLSGLTIKKRGSLKKVRRMSDIEKKENRKVNEHQDLSHIIRNKVTTNNVSNKFDDSKRYPLGLNDFVHSSYINKK